MNKISAEIFDKHSFLFYWKYNLLRRSIIAEIIRNSPSISSLTNKEYFRKYVVTFGTLC